MKPKDVPASINELMIERHFLRDPVTKEALPDDALSALAGAMMLSRRNAERAKLIAETTLRNQMLTMPERQRRAKKEAWKVIEQAAQSIDSSRAKAEAVAKQLKEAIAAPQRPATAITTIVDGEVRCRLAAMAPDARRAALAEAVRVGDEQVVGAALGGPAMLSGFADRAEQEEFRRQWQTAARGAELDRVERIEKALVDVERAGGLLITYAGSLTDEKIIADAEESERRATEALSAN